jgi:E3 ubiquitin-protein ligase ZNF598
VRRSLSKLASPQSSRQIHPPPLSLVHPPSPPTIPPRLHSNAFGSSLCTQHKKVFTHEHILYTSRELTTHFSTGDPIKDISLTGFTGHPKCRFCNQSLYSFDEFHAHNRERHERCHVCDQINTRRALPDAQPRYFINYDELWKHFQTEHFPCGAPECLEARFVVFESDIDLKAHIMEVHMGRASKAELRDMRRVEVNFRYASGQPSVGRGRGRREEERRDVDISTLPRDEQAYFRIQQAQREMASRQIGNVSIPTREAFPALPSSSPVVPSEPSRRPAPVESFPPLSGPSRPSAPLTPAPSSLPPQVAARHAAVLEKAAHLLNNDKDKLAQFKSHVSAFRHSESSASDLIDRLWDIFNAKLEEFGKLITSTADLFDYDAKPKRSELLGAWNDWKIQVPSNPPPSFNQFGCGC